MIERIVILALISIGACSTMWEGMVFEKYGDWLERNFGEYWSKPLGKCYVCASFWISLIISLAIGWQWWLCFPVLGATAMVSLLSPDK